MNYLRLKIEIKYVGKYLPASRYLPARILIRFNQIYDVFGSDSTLRFSDAG